ncbi:MAG: carbohydrate binding domain-containing protein [Candidatus Levybacteria bacterium]|nr:carbohydrate binding domain-containing protein [Candidatus Levybacteria bacterium]
MEEMKPIGTASSNTRLLKIALPIVGVVALVGGVFLTINNGVQQQQNTQSKASLAANTVANPGFESGTGSWQFNRRSGAATYATTTDTKVGGVSSAQINVTTAASSPQEIELAQYGKSLTAGQTYTVIFWAKGSVARPMDVVIQDGSSPYTELIRKSVPLSTNWQKFTHTFVASQTKSNALIGFQVGKATGTVWLDDVHFSLGTVTSVAPTTAQSGNLLLNPGCESSTDGWTSFQGTLTRITGVARTGTASCLATRSFNDAYTMDDTPNTVKSPKVGEVYSARVWVRSTTAVGKPVRMNIRQWTGSSFTHSFGPYVTLSSSWQEVKTTATITGSDRSEVDAYVVQENAVAGNSFYADDFEFYRGNLPSISTAPTATNAPTPVTPATLSVNKTSVSRGEQITVTWSNISNPTANDWIGLYTPSMASGSPIGRIYVSCSQTATVAKASGSCTFPVPNTAPYGQVELRLHPNDGTTVLAKTPVFTIVNITPTPGLTLVPTTTTAPTATVAPTAGLTLVPTAIPTQVPTIVPTAIAATNTPAPTATPVPGGTTVQATLLLHGLGKGGDSVNAASLGNFTLQRPQRTITMEIFDVQNQLVLTKQGTVTFDTTAGNFVGTVDLGTQVTTGLYTVKIKTDQYLRGLVDGIQTITVGQKTTLTSLTLLNGDVNNDNQINIVDYNIIVGCYSDLLPPISCNATDEVRADINDDGAVNQFDYNLFIRELTNLGGQ